MYFYFFETSMQPRSNGKTEPTLRALPGQKFPDGTPVDTDMNVRAPKEKGSSPNGSRFDYPLGTRFCSSHLEVDNSKKTAFYSVYDSANGEVPGSSAPDFHPVSDDPNFQYVAPSHLSVTMNAAYTSFLVFGDQGGDEDEDTENTNASNMSNNPAGVRFAPTDKSGKARARIEGWQPAYEDQVDIESNLILVWMRKVLNDLGVTTPARRPKLDATTKPLMDELFASGESVDTVASRTRLNRIIADERMDIAGLQTLSKGPFVWYIEAILSEHRKGNECTAEERNPDNTQDLDDAAFIIGTEINSQLGTTDAHNVPPTLADLKTALKAGWTLDDILEPQVLTSQGGIAALASALANGIIPVPQHTASNGTTLLDTLLANPSLKRPKGSKDGFHVDETVWETLLVNATMKINTMLLGPTGCGKTAVVKKLCDKMGIPFTIIPMGSITDPTEQLVGKMDLTPMPNGNVETRYDWADFAMAIQRPGVVLLDEINRIPRNGYNILFSVLDGTRQLPAFGAKGTDKRMVDVHPDCVFFATANVGYAGTEEMDEALKNRFVPIELDYLDEKNEAQVLMTCCGISKEDATNIAVVASDIRKSSKNGTIEHAVSTRETLLCGNYVKYGFSVEKAMEIIFLPQFEGGLTEKDSNCERGAVRAKIAGRFKPSATNQAGA